MQTRRRGLTMLELLVVLLILAALAGVVIPLLSGQSQSAGETATRASITQVRDAVIRYHIDNPNQPPAEIRIAHLFAARAGTANDVLPWNPLTRIGWHGPYLRATGAVYSYMGVDGFDAAYGTGAAAGDPCVFDGYAHADGRRRPIVLVTRTIGTQIYSWLQSAGADGVLTVPTTLTGPPVTAASGSGTDFPTSLGTVHVDDLTLSVYP